MTMKFGLLGQTAVLETKLAEHGFTVTDADHIHQRLAATLHDGPDGISALAAAVGGEPGRTVAFSSVLWPDFDFTAVAASDGSVASAGYRRARGAARPEPSPIQQRPWSMDADDSPPTLASHRH